MINALIGVVVGFLLAQFGASLRDFVRAKEAKSSILEELKSNLGILDQKREIVVKILADLQERRIRSGISVKFMTGSYDFNLYLAYSYLTPIQRDSLHIIYERARIADALMMGFETELLKHIEIKLVDNPYQMFYARMKEVLENFDVIEDLSKQYISGKPVDVLRRLQAK
jgi:hypothetical protein